MQWQKSEKSKVPNTQSSKPKNQLYMFKSAFSFEGRIRRTEYGISYLLYIAAVFAIAFIGEINTDLETVLYLCYIPMLWFLWAQGSKRCHDRGNSGWFQIIPFYVLWMVFADSDFGENGYGLNPKGIGNTDEIDEIGQHLVG